MAENVSWIPQAAAIPVLRGRVCLVTSRSGKRWVIPKGIIDPGKTAAEIALQEAWEEAGLVGVLRPDPVGSYLYEKYGGTCHVAVFLMDVTDAAEQWPEQSFRQRVWLDVRQALQRIDEEGLRNIVRAALEDESRAIGAVNGPGPGIVENGR
ncbi:MAG TPA: NUDIX hydrolase [Gemmataceae bacterium]|nr:NUDIX hydrolase [Gemmataceae bacterium]